MEGISGSLYRTFGGAIAATGTDVFANERCRSGWRISASIIELRPDIWKRLDFFSRPLKEDIDVDLLTTLHRFGLLSEERRQAFVEDVRAAAVEEADDSFLESDDIFSVLTPAERDGILMDVETEVFGRLDSHIERVRDGWDHDYDPNDHFDTFRTSLSRFTEALVGRVDPAVVKQSTEQRIRSAVRLMADDYVPDTARVAPTQQSVARC